ncbi:MAG: sulfotransferase domain-containing protein [Caulobacteraceae bacterium]
MAAVETRGDSDSGPDAGAVVGRARTMAEMAKLHSKMWAADLTDRSIAAWRPRSDDVVISPYSKCGTTWLQQMFHTLRTGRSGGDLDFDDISAVVPWIETSQGLSIDLEAPQKASPRGFKSHLGRSRLPRGSKAIVAFRDPKDALVSLHRFMEGWFLEAGAVSVSEFARGFIDRRGEGRDYWSHLLSWWAERDDRETLLLSYEGMSADPAGAVRAVARFCGIGLDEDLLALTLERSSFSFMRANKAKFDDRLMREASERLCGLPPGSDSAKVRRGAVGSHREELPAELSAELDGVWAEGVTPTTGFADYAEFEAAVRARLA